MVTGRGCRVVVTVPARDEAAFIGDCLESLFTQRELDGRPLDPERLAIVVVDSGSTDDTVAVVKRAASSHPGVSLAVVAAPGSGVARARRAGMDFGAAALRALGPERRILASTDADTVVHPRWIAHLVAAFDSRPEISFVGGGFTYPEAFTSQMASLRHYAASWRKLSRLLAPLRYVETVGSNFAIAVDGYEAIDGIPLFTIGEDLAVAEMAIARGHRGAWLPIANRTSERRAVGDAAEFLTGERRFRSWGSHGRHVFQPCRSTAGSAALFADITPAMERELTRRCLRYFARQHVIKPLVLVSQFRRPVLDLLKLDVAAFEERVAQAIVAHPNGAPFALEDRVLFVDAVFLEPIFLAISEAVEGAIDPDDERPAAADVPFHAHGTGIDV